MWKKTVAGLCILIVGLFVYYYINTELTDVNVNAVNLIKSRMNGRNELVDYDNEIGVDSIKDVGFKTKDDTIYLTYGKVEFKLGKKDLLDKDFLTSLKKIGIEIKRNKKGEYVIYYWGDKVQKWVN